MSRLSKMCIIFDRMYASERRSEAMLSIRRTSLELRTSLSYVVVVALSIASDPNLRYWHLCLKYMHLPFAKRPEKSVNDVHSRKVYVGSVEAGDIFGVVRMI